MTISRHSTLLFLILSVVYLFFSSCYASRTFTSPEEYAKLGDEALATGNFDQAIRHFSEAINGDSSNLQYFWKRSIPYLQNHKYREALSDLNRVLSLDSKHAPALMRRGRTLNLIGKFEEAAVDLEKLLKINPEHKEARELLPTVKNSERKYSRATELLRDGQVEEGLVLLGEVLAVSPTFEKGLLLRARTLFKQQKWESVLDDMTHLLRISPTNTGALYLRGKALLYAGDQETALTHFSTCLNYDAFDDDCKRAKTELQNFRSNFEKANKALELTKHREASVLYQQCLEYDPNWTHMMPILYEKLTRCFLGMNDGKRALEAVDKMISYDDKVQEAFILKGEAYLLLEEWDKAIQEMHNALNLGQTNEARQGLHKAERAKKMALRKDYYKILEIPKTASKREIANSYRKLSMKYHPDKNSDGDSEKMYRDVTEAYDVLRDDEKRRRYDLGEDVDQPPQHHHGSPFNFFYGFQ